MRHIVYMKVHFELMKCINDQLTRAKHASRSAAEASIQDVKNVADLPLG